MKTAFVSPSSYLDLVQPFSTYHLCLTHLVIHNHIYRKFYKARSQAGDYIILDNGAVEKSGKSVPIRDIVTATLLIHPSVVVLPDYLFDGPRTLREMETAMKSPGIRLLRENKSTQDIKIAVVVQGVDEQEWMHSFEVMNSRNDVDLLCIPKVSAQTFGVRWKVLELIKSDVSKPCHLLGSWWRSTLEDVQREASYGFVQGIDTPKPIRLAAQGKSLSQWNTLEHDRSFLERRHNGIDPELLAQNCKDFLEVCGGNK